MRVLTYTRSTHRETMDHPTLVRNLAKPGEDVIRDLTPGKAHLWHMATGASGEAGELLDAVKKYAIYGKDIDRANVVEELGDLEFYIEGIRQELEITREEVLEGNIAKLKKRYGEHVQYSDGAAIARADKEQAPQRVVLEPKVSADGTKTIYDADPCPGQENAVNGCGTRMVRIRGKHAYCANCGCRRPEYAAQ